MMKRRPLTIAGLGTAICGALVFGMAGCPANDDPGPPPPPPQDTPAPPDAPQGGEPQIGLGDDGPPGRE